MAHHQHFTTRRGFITTLGFGGVALYGAWAGYGAAPVPFIHPLGKDPAAPLRQVETAHGGHGATGAVTPEEFVRRHEEFIARFRQPDGSVAVGRVSAPPQPLVVGHDMHPEPDHGVADAGQHQGPAQGGHGNSLADPSMAQPTDLYLLAYRFGFSPDDIRIEVGKSYRIRMMASDITHGASLQLGRGSRIIRLRPNVVSELTVTFIRPGPVLIYCTVFCGAAHDAMKARIFVS